MKLKFRYDNPSKWGPPEEPTVQDIVLAKVELLVRAYFNIEYRAVNRLMQARHNVRIWKLEQDRQKNMTENNNERAQA